MSRKIVAGNWKMNKNREEAFSLFKELNHRRGELPLDVKVIVAPPSLYLSEMSEIRTDEIHLAAQDCSRMAHGAFTGEISAEMLKSSFIEHCIVGHSERRTYHNESNEEVGEKVSACLEAEVCPIFCCGEELICRENETYFDVVKSQLEEGLFHLNREEISEVIIAYEPVWAIGTGKTATAGQAQEMHAFIRGIILAKFGKNIADNISILYGGSCKPDNAEELFAKPDVDGGLIGGAALQADDFIAIIRANH